MISNWAKIQTYEQQGSYWEPWGAYSRTADLQKNSNREWLLSANQDLDLLKPLGLNSDCEPPREEARVEDLRTEYPEDLFMLYSPNGISYDVVKRMLP